MPSNNKIRSGRKIQASQRKLVERGMKIPGVAEVIAVYGSLSHFATTHGHTSVRIFHAAGGNADNEQG